MIFEAVILGILVGRIRGGRLRNIGSQPIRVLVLALSAYFIQWFLNFAMERGMTQVISYTMYLHLFSYILLFLFLFANRKLPGMKIIALGVFLNFIVIAANGGMMPASLDGLAPEYKESLLQGNLATYTVIGPETRLPFLADIIPMPFPRGKMMSPGDAVMALGIFLFLQGAMQSRRHYKLTSLRYRV
ncbi:hypothetical protein SY88_16755 [Clostridiales bacterium PH28_bin88]|nr:hypothetical protein SY88_16755 [Clostridiales bacterium PH28_bin88]